MNSFYLREELEEIGFASVGKDVLISRKVSIYGAEKMHIGNHVRIDDFCTLSGVIAIGNHVHIGSYSALFGGAAGIEFEDMSGTSGRVSIYACSDDYSGEYFFNPTFPGRYRNITQRKVTFRKFSVIGAGCTILPGATLGEGVSVGAMSLVCRDLKAWTIYAGVPCRELKPRSKRLLELETSLMREEKNCD